MVGPLGYLMSIWLKLSETVICNFLQWLLFEEQNSRKYMNTIITHNLLIHVFQKKIYSRAYSLGLPYTQFAPYPGDCC